MSYYIAQILGILVTIGVIVNLQLKKKKQMLILSIIINLMSAANILLLDGFNSGVTVCLVAVIQLFVSLWHERKNTDVSLAEKIIFLVLYVMGGVLGYNNPLDLLSIFAAVFYMLAFFQKKEQNIRLFLLGNMSCWTAYHIIIGSSGVWAQVAGIVSSLIGLFRYRKNKKQINKAG